MRFGLVKLHVQIVLVDFAACFTGVCRRGLQMCVSDVSSQGLLVVIELVAVLTAVHVVPLHSLLGLAFRALSSALFPGFDVKVQVVL